MSSELRAAASAEAARWIVERIHPFAQDVGSVIPEGFEAYARVFHPAERRRSDGELEAVTWAEVAEANGRTVHSEMQFERLVRMWPGSSLSDHGQPPLWHQWPEEGSLPTDLADRLVQLLTPHTDAENHCWFAAWEGFGDIDRSLVMQAPTFELPDRRYYLLEGPLTAALRGSATLDFQSFNLWWPDDRSWCVATEIDFCHSYVGGSSECIAVVLSDPQIEALRAELHHGITRHSDQINPPPHG